MSAVEVNLLDHSISVCEGLDKWIGSIKTKVASRILENLTSNTDGLDRYIECAEIQELPRTFICCSFYQKDINDALTRAGIFMGAGKGMQAGTLPKQSDFTLINYKKLVAGHNLPGPTLTEFFQAVEKADAAAKANPAEAAFAEKFMASKRVASLSGQFYVIGFSIQNVKDQRSVISHEIFHAYHFLNSEYRNTILKFWRDVVSNEDRTAITNEIGRAYNVDDEGLVVDEFQAYLIQSRAEGDRMKNFVAKYRQPLMNELAKFNPVKIA